MVYAERMEHFQLSDLAPRNLRRTWREGGPVITAAILVLCVLVWLIEVISHFIAPQFSELFIAYGVFEPQLFHMLPWTAVTCAFYHALDPLHILGNMMCLVLVGPLLERLYGHIVFAWIYLLSAVGGSVGVSLSALISTRFFGPNSSGALISVYGASGAIFGLFGALLMVYRGQMTSLLILLALNFALPFFDSQIAWQAHIGGFVIGLLFAFVLSRTTRWTRWNRNANRRMNRKMSFTGFASIWALALVVLEIGALVGLTSALV